MADQRILFAKYGTAKYISHLDLMHTMERAFLRAGITIRHTAGFHPHPYVSIPLPLPLFFSSQCELLEFGLIEGSTMEQLPEQMNKVLRYAITLEFDGDVAKNAEESFLELVSRESFVVQKKSKKSKKGFTEVDLIPLIEAVEDTQAQGDTLRMTLLLQAQNPGLNPAILLQGFREEYPQFSVVYSTCHRVEILDEEKKVYR